jgi:hypothetical protein
MIIHIYVYIVREREQDFISGSEATTGGGRGKENVKKWKILKHPIYI